MATVRVPIDLRREFIKLHDEWAKSYPLPPGGIGRQWFMPVESSEPGTYYKVSSEFLTFLREKEFAFEE